MLDPLAWKAGGAELAAGDENEALLTAVLAAALTLPETTRLRIEGHTDDRGDPAALKKLAAARAAALAKWLADHGIDRTRIASEGVGPDQPVATNATEAGRAENRRIEIHLVPEVR
jgi:outer membrane protein OmpA-like peptidoglycan-associated protein